MHISIKGISSVSGLGSTIQEHQTKIDQGHTALQSLQSCPWLDLDTKEIQGAWIEDRSLSLSRKWAPASKLSIEAAKAAIADAGLSSSELKNAAVIAGTSRGNAWLGDWPMRRPFKIMAASNSMHGEIASAVTIELGITGPWQVLSSGCAASLDAIGYAHMMLKAGVVKHAIVIGVELPIIDKVIQSYLDTGVLSQSKLNDPYSEQTSGFHPGESASAIVLEATEEVPASKSGSPELLGYWCNSDAQSPIGMPEDGNGLADCLKRAVADLAEHSPIKAICPHASGTLLHAKAEQQALISALCPENSISLHLLKPYTGHTVGASGMLDTAILAHYLRQSRLPPNLPNLTPPPSPFFMPDHRDGMIKIDDGIVLKISVGMGGHNSIIALKP